METVNEVKKELVINSKNELIFSVKKSQINEIFYDNEDLLINSLLEELKINRYNEVIQFWYVNENTEEVKFQIKLLNGSYNIIDNAVHNHDINKYYTFWGTNNAYYLYLSIFLIENFESDFIEKLIQKYFENYEIKNSDKWDNILDFIEKNISNEKLLEILKSDNNSNNILKKMIKKNVKYYNELEILSFKQNLKFSF